MAPLPPLGAVLAGGHSRRMGRDKALLLYRGEPLIRRVARVLGSLLPEVVIVSPRRTEYEFLELPILPDIQPDCGPLGGLHAALTHARGRPVFAMACDLPFVGGELVRHILGYPTCGAGLPGNRPSPGETGGPSVAKIPLEGGRLHPLCGWYSPGCRKPAEESLHRKDLKVLDFLHRIRTIPVPVTEDLPFFRKGLLFNINSNEDYESTLRETGPAAPPCRGGAGWLGDSR